MCVHVGLLILIQTGIKKFVRRSYRPVKFSVLTGAPWSPSPLLMCSSLGLAQQQLSHVNVFTLSAPAVRSLGGNGEDPRREGFTQGALT